MNTAVISLIIFGVCLVLFIAKPLPQWVIAVTGLLVMLLFNVLPFSKAFSSYSGTTVVLVVGMMIVGKAAFDTGLAPAVGRAVLQLAHNDERRIVIYGTLITGVMSAFLSNIASLSIMIYMMSGIARSDPRIKLKNVIMPVAVGAELGGMATLVGSTPQVTAQGLLEKISGDAAGFSFFTFSIPGFLIIIIASLFTGYIAYPIGKKLWGDREDSDIDDTAGSRMMSAPVEGKMGVMAGIFVVLLLLFFFINPIKKIIPPFNNAVVAAIAAVLCLWTGCIKPKEAINGVDWALIIWLGACLGMAEGINASGGGEILANFVGGLMKNSLSPRSLFTIFMILTVVLTQFFSNSTVVTLVLPIALPLVTALGLNPYPFAVGIAMASQVAVGTPIANATIAMAMVANYRFGDFIKYNLFLILICTAILVLMVPLLYPLV